MKNLAALIREKMFNVYAEIQSTKLIIVWSKIEIRECMTSVPVFIKIFIGNNLMNDVIEKEAMYLLIY